ncbi:low-density lipoprotein receptor class A repeat-containing protein [Enhygromyxa salina]|uniref:FG-GAP repeat protein n=1 Tax=Enhygromyxa salina TaxID=215803 RepID=A0A2S9YN97_9BACT|nr:low-density lipoprotein receptor class A repeat-containing protein [Enhygromyxa salina]PRQ06561.1 hypothetical protein ENSA7_37140 [Enhygromyxa salina]
MDSNRYLLFALGSAALIGVTLGACFNGADALGLPCDADSQCGPTLTCIDGFCGGCQTDEACGNAFYCDDGDTIPFSLICDDQPDCANGEDEVAQVCVPDGCTDLNVYEFFEGPKADGAADPFGLLSGNFIGGNGTDFLLARRGGTFVKVLEFLPGMPPNEYRLSGDEMDVFVNPVLDVIPYDFDADTDTDILVRTGNGRLYGYISDPANGPPTALHIGDNDYFDIPGDPMIVDMALGRLNADDFVDIVIVTEAGLVLTAIGDPQAIPLGEVPFDLSFSLMPRFPADAQLKQVQLADTDDGGDELLAIGSSGGGPKLWILTQRAGGMPNDFWNDNPAQPIPIQASEFVLGNLDGELGDDIAFMDGPGGRLAVFARVDPGVFMPAGDVIELEVPTSGLAVVDFNCDMAKDLIFNVESPPGVRVLFAEADGTFSADNMLTIDSEGAPQGALGLMQFDGDGSWDVFHTVDVSGVVVEPTIRSFVSLTPQSP